MTLREFLTNAYQWADLHALALLLASLAWGLAGTLLAHVAFKQTLMDANAWLLLVPLVGVLVSVLGIHRVFPLSELASVRTLRDLVGFAVACLWGVAFLGGLGSLALIAVLTALLLRVLYRRAFG